MAEVEMHPELIKINQSAKTANEAIRQTGQLLVDNGYAEPGYVDSMIDRNKDVSVYMGNFVAIPHGTTEGKKYIKKTGISVVQYPNGVDFSNDPAEEQLVIVSFGIAGIGKQHLDLLSKIALFCSDIKNVEKLADARSADEIISLIGGMK